MERIQYNLPFINAQMLRTCVNSNTTSHVQSNVRELEKICFVILLAIFAGVRSHRRSLQLDNESAGGYVMEICRR